MSFLSWLLGEPEDEITRTRRKVDRFFEQAEAAGEYGWQMGAIADLIPSLIRHYHSENDLDTSLLYITRLQELIDRGIIPDPYQSLLVGQDSIYAQIMAARGTRIFRLLWLDNRDGMGPLKRDLGGELRNRLEVEPGVWSPYVTNPVELGRIFDISGSGVDYTVIGHNRGVGVDRAEAVAESVRENACVVSESRQDGVEEPYRQLGYQTFLLRRELVEHFRGVMEAFLESDARQVAGSEDQSEGRERER